jgi:hypothetical protein
VQHLGRPRRAPLFVVGRARVVNDIMEPQRRFHLIGPIRFRLNVIKLFKAICDVGRVVVSAVRLRVGLH